MSAEAGQVPILIRDVQASKVGGRPVDGRLLNSENGLLGTQEVRCRFT